MKRILVIKHRHLGDVLLSGPVFANLKKEFPGAAIDAYIWEEAYPMLEGHPAIDRFILYDRKVKKLPLYKRAVKELNYLRTVRANHYDMVINLTEGDRGALAAFVSGARVRVGVDPKKRWKRKIFTDLVKHCPNPRHTVEKDLDVLRKIGIYPRLDERSLYFHVPNEAKERVQTLVKEPFVLVHPVARWRFKCLPAPLMASVMDQLDKTVVLTGGSSEQDLVMKIADLTSAKVINLAGKTTLKEMGALMELCEGMITVDSVPLHMASALKTPVVALFGPTSEENWGPWQHLRSVVVAQNLPCRPCRLDGCGGSKMSDCLWTLSVQEIVEAYASVTGAGVSSSTSSLLVLNSLETNKTE